MFNKSASEITELEVRSLLDDGVRENSTLEYKSALPGNIDSDKIKFIAEVVAFANTQGGLLIIGVQDENGAPKAINGVQVTDVDSEILRLEQILRNGCEPKIVGIQIAPLRWGENYVILIKIPKSWTAPHCVSLKDHSKFYSRNSAGKYPMDVHELRNAFLTSEEIPRRIRAFRSERIDKLNSRHELPVDLYSGSLLVMHLIPLSAFTFSQTVEVRHDNERALLNLSPLGASGWNSRLNLDGVVTFSGRTDQESRAYTQLFRNGIVEAVASIDIKNEYGHTLVHMAGYEEILIHGLSSFLKYYTAVGIDIPYYCFLTLSGVLNAELASDTWRYALDGRPKCDRSVLMLPETVITDIEKKAHEQLQRFL
jgi:hypothetical protein